MISISIAFCAHDGALLYLEFSLLERNGYIINEYVKGINATIKMDIAKYRNAKSLGSNSYSLINYNMKYCIYIILITYVLC